MGFVAWTAGKLSFAVGKNPQILKPMDQAAQIEALEAARRAGIDLDLLDSNLALTYAQRWLEHSEALGKL